MLRRSHVPAQESWEISFNVVKPKSLRSLRIRILYYPCMSPMPQAVKSTMKFCSSKFMNVNKAVYEWYLLACLKNIFPGGSVLIEKAKEIAEQLGISDFKGSRGWLDKWKLKYNIKQVKVCGESGDVRGVTIDSWKERLPEILEGYAKKTSGIWMRLECSGKLCLTMVLGAKDSSVREARRVSRGYFLCFSRWQKGETYFYMEV